MKVKRTIDISQPLLPDRPEILNVPSLKINLLKSSLVNGINSESIEMGIHSGTHLDAPFHYFENGTSIDNIPIEQFQGEAVILKLFKKPGKAIRVIDVKEYEKIIGSEKIILFNTGWSQKRKMSRETYCESPYVDKECALWLASKNIRGVGIDHFSISGMQKNYSREQDCHIIFLRNGIWILEGIVFPDKDIGMEGWYLVAFPLFLRGCSGSPTRAVLIRFGEE